MCFYLLSHKEFCNIQYIAGYYHYYYCSCCCYYHHHHFIFQIKPICTQYQSFDDKKMLPI